MKLLNRSEKGFTLIELLIALPIIAIVVAAATGTLIQVIQSTSTSAHMVALRQVQTAGYWVSKDGLQTQNITGNLTTSSALHLNWIDWEDQSYNITYSLVGPTDGPYQLQRTDDITDTITIVGQYLTNHTICSWNSTMGILILTVEASVPGARGQQTEGRTYEIKPRPD